jgi:hypothetical protein
MGPDCATRTHTFDRALVGCKVCRPWYYDSKLQKRVYQDPICGGVYGPKQQGCYVQHTNAQPGTPGKPGWKVDQNPCGEAEAGQCGQYRCSGWEIPIVNGKCADPGTYEPPNGGVEFDQCNES